MIKVTNKGKKAWVTFTYPSSNEESISLSGEWNDWEQEPMKKKKNGEFYLTKVLDTDRSYEFGYKTASGAWECDNDLGCVATPFSSHNSLLEL